MNYSSNVKTLISRRAFLLLMEFFQHDKTVSNFYEFLSTTNYTLEEIREPYNELVKAGFVKGQEV